MGTTHMMTWQQRLNNIKRAHDLILKTLQDTMQDEPSAEAVCFASYLGVIRLILSHIIESGSPVETTPLQDISHDKESQSN